MRIGPILQGRGVSLVGAVALLALVGFVAANCATAWQNYKLRTRIAKELAQAQFAKALVMDNVTRGRQLDSGWLPAEQSIAGERITISRETGIITFAFSGEVEGAPRNLKLLPVSKGRLVKLTGSPGAGNLDWTQIYWACMSRDTRYAIGYAFTVPPDGLGSLPSRYAPANCR